LLHVKVGTAMVSPLTTFGDLSAQLRVAPALLLEPPPPATELLEPPPTAAVTVTVPQGISSISIEPQVALTLITKLGALVFGSTSQLSRPFQVI